MPHKNHTEWESQHVITKHGEHVQACNSYSGSRTTKHNRGTQLQNTDGLPTTTRRMKRLSLKVPRLPGRRRDAQRLGETQTNSEHKHNLRRTRSYEKYNHAAPVPPSSSVEGNLCEFAESPPDRPSHPPPIPAEIEVEITRRLSQSSESKEAGIKSTEHVAEHKAEHAHETSPFVAKYGSEQIAYVVRRALPRDCRDRRWLHELDTSSSEGGESDVGGDDDSQNASQYASQNAAFLAVFSDPKAPMEQAHTTASTRASREMHHPTISPSLPPSSPVPPSYEECVQFGLFAKTTAPPPAASATAAQASYAEDQQATSDKSSRQEEVVEEMAAAAADLADDLPPSLYPRLGSVAITETSSIPPPS